MPPLPLSSPQSLSPPQTPPLPLLTQYPPLSLSKSTFVKYLETAAEISERNLTDVAAEIPERNARDSAAEISDQNFHNATIHGTVLKDNKAI